MSAAPCPRGRHPRRCCRATFHMVLQYKYGKTIGMLDEDEPNLRAAAGIEWNDVTVRFVKTEFVVRVVYGSEDRQTHGCRVD